MSNILYSFCILERLLKFSITAGVSTVEVYLALSSSETSIRLEIRAVYPAKSARVLATYACQITINIWQIQEDMFMSWLYPEISIIQLKEA